jgi:hypothetical protein
MKNLPLQVKYCDGFAEGAAGQRLADRGLPG